MIRTLTLLFYSLLLAAAAIGQQKLFTEKQLPIIAWAGIPQQEISLERFLEMKEMGITINLSTYPDMAAMEKALNLANKVGLKIIASCPELKDKTEETVKKFMHHPALAGYFLKDEPIQKDFADLGAWVKKISSIDSRHFCFINLIAGIHPTKIEALGATSYENYVKAFIQEVPTRVLSYDFYPVIGEEVHERWYESLEIFSSLAQEAKKSFFAFALASSYNALHPTPTLPALRLQQFSNLAYGALGLQYWSYWMSDGLQDAPLGADGKRTPAYDKIKEINKEVQDLATVFMGAKLKWVRHTGTVIPRGTTRLSQLPEAIRVFETDGPGALVSLLENGPNNFFVVVNRSLKETLKVFIYGNDSLRKVLKDGKIVPAGKYSPATEIEPGDVAIYMFPSKN